MTGVRSVLLECSCYSGRASHERRKAVEECAMERVTGACRVESATMREVDMGDGVVQPSVERVYSGGNYRRLIPMVDGALREIGIMAVKALVSAVEPLAAEGVIAGAGAGWLAGGAAAAGGSRGGSGRSAAAAMLAGTVIGAALGAIGGKTSRERSPMFVATRHAGGWAVKRFPRG